MAARELKGGGECHKTLLNNASSMELKNARGSQYQMLLFLYCDACAGLQS